MPSKRPSLNNPTLGEEEVKEIITYVPFLAQQAFHNGKETYRLYGGAAGGGKSRALRAEAVRMATSKPDFSVNGLVLRKTYSELEKAIIRPLLGEISGSEFTYNASDHKMVFKNGSTIDFGHCQYDKDVIKYQGAEYDFIAIDELTHFSEYAFKFLMSRLRTAKVGVKPSFFGTTNPGGIGHLWVKRLWIDRQFSAKENPDDYIFYPASVYDNPALLDNDPEYVSRLESLPDTERRAMLEGDWNVFEGQYFDEWRDEIHVIDPFQIPAGARRIICVDYGYAAPSAVLWLAEFNEKIFCYRELYETRLTYKMLSEKIISNTPETEKIDAIIIDPSLFAKEGESAKSGAEIMRENGLSVLAANNERLAGWNLLRQFLKTFIDPNSGKQTAKLQVFKTCTNLIRTLPSLIHDKIRVEDLDSRGEDHMGDAARYGIMWLQKHQSIGNVFELTQRAASQNPALRPLIQEF